MRLRRTSGSGLRLPGLLCLGAALLAGTVVLGGCGPAAKPKAAAPVNCGSSRTAANVPIEVQVDHGQLACSAAMAVEKGYAAAIVSGKVPGNGGEAPVVINGWTCQGIPTPESLKTGDASKCAKNGTEIIAVLKT